MASDDEALLERKAESEALNVLLGRAEQGRGGVLTVEGPAGIGKTRLLGLADQVAQARGFRVRAAVGAELEQQFAFGVAVRLLEPSYPSGGDGGGPGDELAAFERLYWRCVEMVVGGPACLVVDDAQWVDEPSLRFLGFLGRRVSELPVAVIVAAREVEAPGLADLHGLGAVLRPAALSGEAVAELARLILGPADDEFCRACATASGGNPFYVTELFREAQSRAIPATAAGARAVASLSPRGLVRAISDRLDRLGPAAGELAAAAAVLGEGAELPESALVAGLDIEEAESIADRLSAAGVLADARPLRFGHPVIRAAVTDGLRAGARADLHRRAAAVLTAGHANGERVAAQLMHTTPGRVPSAVSNLTDAARAARAGGATETAIAYLVRALREPLDEVERAHVLGALGSAELAAGRPEAVDHLLAAHAGLSHPVARARVVPELVQALTPVDRGEEALAILDATIESVRPFDGDLADGLFAYSTMISDSRPALAHLVEGRLEQVAVRTPRTRWERIAIGRLAQRRMESGAPAQAAVALARRALTGAAGGHDIVDVLAPVLVLLNADELDDAERVLTEQRAVASHRGAAAQFAFASALRAGSAFKRGALEEAEADAREALGASEPGGWQGAPALAALVDALCDQGRRTDAQQELANAGWDGELPDFRPFTPLLLSRGRLRIELGSFDDGRVDLETALARMDAGRGRHPAGLDARAVLALAHLGRGDREAASTLAAESESRAKTWGTARAMGWARHTSAMVEGGSGAVDALTESTALLARSPARLEYARSLVSLGSALRRANRRADAREPLRAGLALAQDLAAAPLAATATEELRATGARPRSIVRIGVDALTPSEHRIASRAAEGLSNPEIARSLFLSIRTVEMHLTSAYRKLDVGSRRELPAVLHGSRA